LIATERKRSGKAARWRDRAEAGAGAGLVISLSRAGEGGLGCRMISASALVLPVPAGLAGWGKGSRDGVGCVFIERPLPFLVQRLMARLAR